MCGDSHLLDLCILLNLVDSIAHACLAVRDPRLIGGVGLDEEVVLILIGRDGGIDRRDLGIGLDAAIFVRYTPRRWLWSRLKEISSELWAVWLRFFLKIKWVIGFILEGVFSGERKVAVCGKRQKYR